MVFNWSLYSPEELEEYCRLSDQCPAYGAWSTSSDVKHRGAKIKLISLDKTKSSKVIRTTVDNKKVNMHPTAPTNKIKRLKDLEFMRHFTNCMILEQPNIKVFEVDSSTCDVTTLIGALYGRPTVSPIYLSLVDNHQCCFAKKPSKVREYFNESMVLAVNEVINCFKLDKPSALFTLEVQKLRVLKSLKSLKNSSNLQILELLISILCNIDKLQGNYDGIFYILNAIEDCFHRRLYGSCPGLDIRIPPTSGKTYFGNLYTLGFLDTDLINGDLMNQDPRILENLIAAGFSILSNRWEKPKHDYIYMGPTNLTYLQQHLRQANIYPSYYEQFKKEKRKYYKSCNLKGIVPKGFMKPTRKIQYNQEKWIAAYKELMKGIYYDIQHDNIVRGMMQLYADVLAALD